MKKIISKVRKSINPGKSLESSKTQIANLAFKLVEEELKKFPEVISLEFGGSYAKGTWLSKNADVDIFIKFKKNNFGREICRNFRKNWICLYEKA